MSDDQLLRCLTEEEIAAYLWEHPAASGPRSRVEAHAAACERCRVWLAESARGQGSHDVPLAEHAISMPAPRTLEDGVKVAGRYQIRRLLGRGGMGEVYEAHDLALDETVALKTLACTCLDSPDLLARFKAEVRLARRVTHPNVCRVLEFGLARLHTGDAIPYLTMELLIGCTLAEQIRKRGPLALEEVHALARQLVEGLTAVHAVGIVHRDLKASNVMLLDGGAAVPRAVIMDFGLAKNAERGPWNPEHPSHSGLAGTLAYMAPEQLTGGSISARTDVYALGVVLFEMLTGRLPFAADEVFSRLAERDRVPPPSLRELRRGVPESWAAVERAHVV